MQSALKPYVSLLAYIPYGETLLDLSDNTGYQMPHQFAGYEKDQESGLSYAGARYYNAKYSVFTSVDRFALKYPWQSPYCYAGNNPIANIDVNGDSVWYTGRNNTVTMHVRAKLINISQDDINIDRATADIANGIKNAFSGKFTHNGQIYNMATDIQIAPVESMNEVDKSDHLFVIRNADGKSARGAINTNGGKVINLPANDYANDNWFSNTFMWNSPRSAVHEFGHAIGLTHETASGFRNLMTQGGGGTNITSKQRINALTVRERINRGPNSYGRTPYPFVHDPITGKVYKASHLLNWNTRYRKR